jgi:hypothetical protein
MNPDVGTFHVVPMGDLREHKPSASCWCKPRQDDQDPMVFIHNALDQREKYESQELRPH